MQSLSRVGFCIQDLGGGTVHNCRFVNLTVTKEMQAGCKVEGANGDVSASDCYFSEMFNYTSGATSFQYIYGQTKVERMRFIECHPNLAAGGSALIVAARTNDIRPELPTWYAEIPNDNPVISDCWFEATEKASLADLYVEVFPEMKQTSVTEIWSTSNPFSISWEGTAINTIRQTPKIVIDEQAGVDEEFCWMRENGCRTMSETINDRTSGKFEGTFLLVSDSHSDSGVEVGQRKLVMKSQPETKATISDEGSSAVLFSISTGSLDLSSVDFSPHIESSLFVLSGAGELKVTDNVIDGSSLGEAELSKPLFDRADRSHFWLRLLSRDLEIDLLFPDASCGSGVVVEGRMGSASTVSISESEFTECHTLDEDYVEHDDPANPGAEPNVVNHRGGRLPSLAKPSTLEQLFVCKQLWCFDQCSFLARLFITSCRFHNQFASGFRAQGGAISGWIISDMCGAGIRVIHTYVIARMSFQNCSFINCLGADAETAVIGIYGEGAETVAFSKCYVLPDFSTNKKGVVRLTGIFETNPEQATFDNCGFLSASPHLLPSTIQKDGIGFATLRVSKGEVGGEKEERIR
ncbi:hypothetical protein BLNAU_23849 [Blattamonas nauphoetae]|uniref:Right handed beta helix domain-containing protein n=1 Tax=Blattamonas nauphoetae TaxID=2049346 RepID=A0ABQ9WT74_9EUKA|nr:hypothetical protein BLNAU_23849 [Blattamonas nauphoetae]